MKNKNDIDKYMNEMPNIASATLMIAENAPPLKQIYKASLQHFLAAAATLTFALTLTHMPAQPDNALQLAPIKKLMLVMKAIEVVPKYRCIFEFPLAGYLCKYTRNNKQAHATANLKIVPY